MLLRVLGWASLLATMAHAARAPVDVHPTTGAISVPEYLKPLHRRARSTQRLTGHDVAGLNLPEAEVEVSPSRPRRNIDVIKNVTDGILHKSVCGGVAHGELAVAHADNLILWIKFRV